jgi:DNA-binding GntR family transcriptional regulator
MSQAIRPDAGSRPATAGAPAQKAAARDRNIDETVHRVADELEEDIVLGVLNPRERLVEDELRERYGLKRHVARQVLAEVEQRGLVERRKNVGAVVKSYTSLEVAELYAMREILETSAVQRIALPVATDALDAIAAIQVLHDEAAQAGDLRRVFRLNMAFHQAFFALSENRILAEAIREYQRRTHAIRSASNVFPHYLEKARVEHHQMLHALASGDRDWLMRLCREHLLPSRDAYLDAHHRRSLGTALRSNGSPQEMTT